MALLYRWRSVYWWKSTLRFGRGHNKTRHAIGKAHSTRLAIESLEDRCLLAAAVGVFQRIGGELYVEAGATARVPSLTVDDRPPSSSNEVLDYVAAGAVAADEFGTAESLTSAEAACLTPIGNSIPVPQVTSAVSTVLFASGDFPTEAVAPSTTAVAQGVFNYIPDPEFTEDPEFHGHLFISGYGGAVEV